MFDQKGIYNPDHVFEWTEETMEQHPSILNFFIPNTGYLVKAAPADDALAYQKGYLLTSQFEVLFPTLLVVSNVCESNHLSRIEEAQKCHKMLEQDRAGLITKLVDLLRSKLHVRNFCANAMRQVLQQMGVKIISYTRTREDENFLANLP